MLSFCIRWRNDVAKMRMALEKCNIYAKFCNECHPWYIECQRTDSLLSCCIWFWWYHRKEVLALHCLYTYPHLEQIYPWLLPVLVALIVNTAVDCCSHGQAIVLNAVILTQFCTMFWQRIGEYSEHFESENFTMSVSVTQFISCSETFDECGCASKQKWKWVPVNSSQIGVVRCIKSWRDVGNQIGLVRYIKSWWDIGNSGLVRYIKSWWDIGNSVFVYK